LLDVEQHQHTLPPVVAPSISRSDSLSPLASATNLPAPKEWHKACVGEVVACSIFAIVLGMGVWLTIFHFAPRLGLYLGWLPALQVGFWSYVYPLAVIEILAGALSRCLASLS
jgi:hypothetical protein